MLNSLQVQEEAPRIIRPRVRRPAALRSIRPSLLDLRFTGDPWLADHCDGTASVCLDDYRLVSIGVLSLDVPSLYHALVRMRQCQIRHQGSRRRAQLAQA